MGNFDRQYIFSKGFSLMNGSEKRARALGTARKGPGWGARPRRRRRPGNLLRAARLAGPFRSAESRSYRPFGL